MGIAVCGCCGRRFVVSRVRQPWEKNCPGCGGRLLHEEEVRRQALLKRACAAVEMSKLLRQHHRDGGTHE